jgi:DNA-binding transcriptional LysR family regulator
MSVKSNLESLRGIVVFVGAVQAGGFAAAGRNLGVSASAVGKAVSRLEARLGVSLMHRTTRSLALTAEGELLYARSARILDDLREAENAISKARGAPKGRLKVSVPTVLGRRVIVPALPRFLAAYPEVELDLWLDDRKVDIVEEGFDAVVRLGELTDSRLIARKIAPHQFTTCAAQTYLAAHGSPKTPAELVAHRCIRYRFPSTGRLEQWAFKGTSAPQALGEGLVLNDGEALAWAALAGLGLVQVPAYLVSDDLAAGRLQRVLVQYTADRGDIWLVWPEVRADIPRVRVFLDFVSTLANSGLSVSKTV